MNTAATPDRTALFMDPGLRRDDGEERDDGKWAQALALLAQAEAELEALAHTGDDDLYGRAPGRRGAALARLLRAPAPDLAAVAAKLDLILRRPAVELAFGNAAMASPLRDIRRFAALPRSSPPCASRSSA